MVIVSSNYKYDGSITSLYGHVKEYSSPLTRAYIMGGKSEESQFLRLSGFLITLNDFAPP